LTVYSPVKGRSATGSLPVHHTNRFPRTRDRSVNGEITGKRGEVEFLSGSSRYPVKKNNGIYRIERPDDFLLKATYPFTTHVRKKGSVGEGITAKRRGEGFISDASCVSCQMKTDRMTGLPG